MWRGEGALRMRRRCLNDVVREAGGAEAGNAFRGGSGSGRTGGGRGALVGFGEDGIVYKSLFMDTPALERCERRSASSGRGGS